MKKKIIDVSGYNGVVNWESAKKYGTEGAILKIIRKDLTRDKQFNNNYKGCHKNGIPWGVYNYTYATTAKKAESDMNLICDILDKIDKKYFKYGIWFDIEDSIQAKLSKPRIAEIINTAQRVVEKRGYKFGIYTGMAYRAEHIDRKAVNCKVYWIARYYKGYEEMGIAENPNEKYRPAGQDTAWQYTSSCVFPESISTGNKNRFDASIWYTNEDEKKEDTKQEDTKKEEKPKEKKGYTGSFPVLKEKEYLARPDGIKTKGKRKNVQKMQRFLNWALGEKLKVDGKIGSKTEIAIERFQELVGIKVDGKFGAASLKKAKEYKR